MFNQLNSMFGMKLVWGGEGGGGVGVGGMGGGGIKSNKYM